MITTSLPTLCSFQNSNPSKNFFFLLTLCKTLKPFLTSSSSSSSMEYMSPQEQEIVNYFNEYMRQSQTAEGKSPGSSSSIMLPPPPSSPAKNAMETAINENHIVRRPATIHCNLLASDLQVLKELRVDFNNLAANGMDLRQIG